MRTNNPLYAFNHCIEIAESINEKCLRKVALDVLNENKEIYLRVKGSDFQHHNYRGGLIVHTYHVTENAIRIAEYYSDKVSIDLVKFGALMHDVGKLFDYQNDVKFENHNDITINQALLGHGVEGVTYISNKLRCEYASGLYDVTDDYINTVITQCSHCILAHMSEEKQQMLEVKIIGAVDLVDAYIDQTILESGKDSFIIGTGETFYKAIV